MYVTLNLLIRSNMNKQDAKLIAETITNEQLQQMFETQIDKLDNNG